jgi:hypothetical protein
MATFLISLVLPEQPHEQRDKLKTSLSIAGFRRTIVAANDSTYELPENHYLLDSSCSTDALKSATRVTSCFVCERVGVVVLQLENCTVLGLCAPVRA